MKIKNNKGFVGVDATIAIIILLIFIPTISAMIYNINKENKSIERKSQALNFAVNVMETTKKIELQDLSLEKIETEIINYYNEGVIISNTELTDGIINIAKDNINYNLTITIQDYSEIDNTVDENRAKWVKVVVTYLVGGNEQNIELATVVY